MGAGHGGHATIEAQQKEAERQFNGDQMSQLRVTFRNLSENHQHFHKEHFKVFCSRLLPEFWSETLYGEISDLIGSDHNGYATFICGMAKLLKGSREDFAHITSALMGNSNFHQTVEQLVDIYFRVETGSSQFPTDHSPADGPLLVAHLEAEFQRFCTAKKYPVPLGQMESEVLRKWFSENLLIPKLLQTVFSCLFLPTLPDATLMPRCLGDQRHFRSLLSRAALVAINNQLPLDCQPEWKLLYSTQTMGESFSTFVTSILQKGPTVLAIKDDTGHIFGGFSSTSWSLCPTFFGDDRTFLFRSAPELQLFTPSGFNENFVYLNDHQETLPNGLGFGGRIEAQQQRCHFFSLWIDKNFEFGKSQANCATFNSPQLSHSEQFRISSVEVWACQPDHKVDLTKALTSILDSNPEAKAILTLTGKGHLSDGLRESDSTAEHPENKQRID